MTVLQEAERRGRSLAGYILDEMQLSEQLPMMWPEEDPPFVIPNSFAEFHQHRREYQQFRKRLGRLQTEQDLYRDYVAEDGRGADVFIAGSKQFGDRVSEVLAAQPIAIAYSAFEYNLPPQTLHLILWYRDETSLQDRADYLHGVLGREDITHKDVVLLRNPVFNRSIEAYAHTHVLVRSKLTYDPLFPREAVW